MFIAMSVEYLSLVEDTPFNPSPSWFQMCFRGK